MTKISKRLLSNLSLTYSVPEDCKFLDDSAKKRIDEIKQEKSEINRIAQKDASKLWILEDLAKQEKELRSYRNKLNSLRSIYMYGNNNAYSILMEELFASGLQRPQMDQIFAYINGRGALPEFDIPKHEYIALAVKRETSWRDHEHKTFLDAEGRSGHMLEERPPGFVCCCNKTELDRTVFSRT